MRDGRQLEPLKAAVLCLVCVLIPLLVAVALWLLKTYHWKELWPYNSFLPSPASSFGDWWLIHDQWLRTHFGPGRVTPGSVYYPATYLGVQAVETIDSARIPSLLLDLGIFVVGSVAAICVALWRQGRAVVALGILIFVCSYPFLFTIFTGNVEGWVGALVLGAVAATLRNKRGTAALLLGAVVAMKGVPIVFLPLLWVGTTLRLAVRGSVQCLATAATLTVGAMLLLPGGGPSAFGRIIQDVRVSQKDFYWNLMVKTQAGTHYGNSFLNGIHAFFGEGTLASSQWWRLVALLGGLAIGATLILALRRRAPLWMILSLCASAGCLLVPVSGDYKLLYFVPAIVALLAESEILWAWIPGIVLLCLIPTPKPWGLRPGIDAFAYASVYLTPLLMIALVGWIFAYVLTSLGHVPVDRNIERSQPELQPAIVARSPDANSAQC